jgi:hypothetical protein
MGWTCNAKGNLRIAYKILIVYGMLILKWPLEKHGMRTWIGFNWLNIENLHILDQLSDSQLFK